MADELKSRSNTNEKDKSHTTKNVLEVRRGENRSIKTEKRRKKSGKKWRKNNRNGKKEKKMVTKTEINKRRKNKRRGQKFIKIPRNIYKSQQF